MVDDDQKLLLLMILIAKIYQNDRVEEAILKTKKQTSHSDADVLGVD